MTLLALHKPAPGKTLVVELEPRHTLAFDHAPDEIFWTREGDSLYATFQDGAVIQLRHFFLPGTAGDLFFQFGEDTILAQDLVNAMAADLQTDTGTGTAEYPVVTDAAFSAGEPASGMASPVRPETGEDAFLFESGDMAELDGNPVFLSGEVSLPGWSIAPRQEGDPLLKLEDVLVELPQPPPHSAPVWQDPLEPGLPYEPFHHHVSVTSVTVDAPDPLLITLLLPDVL